MPVVSLTVGKVDAGVTVLLTEDKRLIEFPSILLPSGIASGSIVDIAVSRNSPAEWAADRAFEGLQTRILATFGTSEPEAPVLRCLNVTQTSVVLEWDPMHLATAQVRSLSLFRNGAKAGVIPNPLRTTSTKISGLAVDVEYNFHLVLRTTAGTFTSDPVTVRTHKLTDLSGVTITTGILPAAARDTVAATVARVGARLVDDVRIDTTHFITTEGRGLAWEKAAETNIPVVRPEWIEGCERAGRIIGVTKFYLDAVRPGPTEGTSLSPPTPPPPPAVSPVAARKTLPERKSQRPPSSTPVPAPSRESQSPPHSESGEAVEHAQKVLALSHPNESQKLRLGDKPAPDKEIPRNDPDVATGPDDSGDHDDDLNHHDEDGAEAKKEGEVRRDDGIAAATTPATVKAGLSPDATSSFQDVAL